MKRNFLKFTLLIAIAVSSVGWTQAQLYVGLGYQQGFYNMANANLPVNRFNNRGFLFKNLNKFHWPGGEIYAASYRTDDVILELNLNSRRQRVSAESFSGRTLMRRDIRFSMQSLSLGGGPALVANDEFVLYLYGGLDLGYMRLLTRLAPKDNIARADYYLLRRQSMLAVTASVRMVFRASRESLVVVTLSPYVQYPLQQFDFTIMNQILNPQTWTQDPNPLPGRPINFGLALNFDLDLLSFLED